jgi:hypothetical protein
MVASHGQVRKTMLHEEYKELENCPSKMMGKSKVVLKETHFY